MDVYTPRPPIVANVILILNLVVVARRSAAVTPRLLRCCMLMSRLFRHLPRVESARAHREVPIGRGHSHPFAREYSVCTRATVTRGVAFALLGGARTARRGSSTRGGCARSSLSFLTTGGCGMSAAGANDLWSIFAEWESDRPSQPGRPKKLREYFPTPHSMRRVLADDIDEAVDSDGWYSCKLTEINESHEAYYRDALPEIRAALSRVPKVRYWAKRDDGHGPSGFRETPFDGDAFRLCEEQVLREHGPDAFVVVLYLYSDSCVMSASGAK